MSDPPIIDAIRQGDRGKVEALLQQDAGFAESRTENGVSALLFALYHQQPEIASLIASRKGLLDIFEASAIGDLDRVRALVSSDPAAKDSFSVDGFPPLGLAAYFGHSDVVEYLAIKGADVNAEARNAMKVAPVHAAAARGDVAAMRTLLYHGADPNRCQQGGFVALHSAAANGDVEMVELLLRSGADRRVATTTDGKTPVQLASERGHTAVVALLAGQ